MRINKRAKDYRRDTVRVAGGFGTDAAKQDAEALLRRSVMANLLWEDNFYENGQSITENIKAFIPHVDPNTVFEIAVEARHIQKLRHIPLLIAREMARLPNHKKHVGKLLPLIIQRPDEITEFVSIYWKNGKQPLSKQVKIGLAAAFNSFDEYQLAKYNRNTEVKLKDVAFLVHPKPPVGKKGDVAQPIDKKGYKRGEVFRHDDFLVTKLIKDELKTPDTWEVALSSEKDKKESWTRLIKERKLGALAFLRNLRNMIDVGVADKVIRDGFDSLNAKWLLPLNYIAAAKHAPKYLREIEELMFRSQFPTLVGRSIVIVDVSGSMVWPISGKSNFTRMDIASSLAVMAAEMSDQITVYATAGSDYTRTHQTKFVPPKRGFALIDEIYKAQDKLELGGIFTRQAVKYVREQEKEDPDRIIVISDSQDCDLPNAGMPEPFGKYNYIIDVAAHTRGINYDGVWDAEISGWSDHFLTYIAKYENTIQEDLSQQ